jgi:hypothetical protein
MLNWEQMFAFTTLLGRSHRFVAYAEFKNAAAVNVKVSCVFLDMDHNHPGVNLSKPDRTFPLVWECMIFGGKLDEAQYRVTGCLYQAQALFIRVLRYALAVDKNIETITLAEIEKEFGLAWLSSPRWEIAKRKERCLKSEEQTTSNEAEGT